MKKILVIGEACIDIFEYGKCTRLNPEAPTPIFQSDHIETNGGMASNVYGNINYPYVMEDDIWDKIEGDVEQRIADSETSGIDEGWIQENLETYTSQNAGNQCRLGKAVWDAIVYTVRGDITLHWAEVNRGETNFSRVAGVDTFMSDLVRLIEIVSERTTINVIEQEKQKYLANRNEYLENPVSASLVDSETKITVSQFQEFINSLDLFQETKDSILNKFSTTRIKFQQ